MKHYLLLAGVLLLTARPGAQPRHKLPSTAATPYSVLDAYAYREETITDVIRRVAEYQLEKYGEQPPVRDWLVGTFYSSFVAAYAETGDRWYLDQAYVWGERSGWDIERPLHADDVCPAQTYLDLYFIKGEPKCYRPVHDKLSALFGRAWILPGEKEPWLRDSLPLVGRNLWSWADALYMAPPVYARLGRATGEARYYSMLHELYWDAVDFLYAPDEGLFHRDSRAQTEHQRTPNGLRVFWSRGNGWVLGGLARLIEFLPAADPARGRYLELFRTLAHSVARYQMDDGLWRASLNDPAWLPTKETSGSAFYVYAIAKGINTGWLPREYFAPVALRGWSGLLSCVTPEGKLGYSQIVAGSPHEVRPHDNKDYAAGAFILAGTEMLRLRPAAALAERAGAAFVPRLVARDAGWDPAAERVIFHDSIFYATYRKGDGSAAFTAFSVERWSSAHARKEHLVRPGPGGAAAVLLPRGEGLVALYRDTARGGGWWRRSVTVPRWTESHLAEPEPLAEGAAEWGRRPLPTPELPPPVGTTGQPRLEDDEVSPDGTRQLLFSRVGEGGGRELVRAYRTREGEWRSQRLGFAGAGGGATLWPGGGRVVLSTTLDPATGEPLPGGHYQLFRGQAVGDHWRWTQLTFDPAFDNLHPTIVRGPRPALFWMNATPGGRGGSDVLMSFKF